MKLQSIPPFSWFRRKKDEGKRKKKILLWTLIPISLILIALSVFLGCLYGCQKKLQVVPDFEISNVSDMPTSLTVGYAEQDTIITTTLDNTYKLTFDKSGDIDAYLSFTNTTDTSTHLIIATGLAYNIHPYNYAITITASKEGCTSKTKTFDFNLRLNLREMEGEYSISSNTPNGLYPGYIKPTGDFTANYSFYSVWKPDLIVTPGSDTPDTVIWSLANVSESIHNCLSIDESTGVISLDSGITSGTYSYTIKATLEKDRCTNKEVSDTETLTLIDAWPSVTFTSTFDTAPITMSGLADFEEIFFSVNANTGSTLILPGTNYSCSVQLLSKPTGFTYNGSFNTTIDSSSILIQWWLGVDGARFINGTYVLSLTVSICRGGTTFYSWPAFDVTKIISR